MKTVLLAAIVLLPSSAFGQDFAASRAAWEQCVLSKVDEFSTSPRSASDIATAALGLCHQSEAVAKRDFSAGAFKAKTFDDFRRELFESAVARIVSAGQ